MRRTQGAAGHATHVRTRMISTNPTRTVKLASGVAAMRSKIVSMTCGMTPLGVPSAEKELPMVYVLPEPVCSSSRAQQSASQARPTANMATATLPGKRSAIIFLHAVASKLRLVARLLRAGPRKAASRRQPVPCSLQR